MIHKGCSAIPRMCASVEVMNHSDILLKVMAGIQST